MPSFVPPLDPDQAEALSSVELRLESPSRYPRHEIVLGDVRPTDSAASFRFAIPCAATIRHIPLSEPLPGGVESLFELSPLPFGYPRTFFRLSQGVPTFYCGSAQFDLEAIDDGTYLPVGEELPWDLTRLYLGAVFQDGATIAPPAWIELIDAAMQADESSDAAVWRGLHASFSLPSSLFILDHAGQPLRGGQTFEVRVISGAATVAEKEVLLGADWDLQAAVGATAGAPASLFEDPGTELRWKPSDAALPIATHYESGESVGPGQWFPISVLGATHGHVMVADIDQWLAEPPADVNVERFHENSRLEPLVDGIPTFRRMLADLQSARDAATAQPDPMIARGFGAHLLGWRLIDHTLDPKRSDVNLLEVLDELRVAGGSARALSNLIIQFIDEGATTSVLKDLVAGVTMLALLGDAIYEFFRTRSDPKRTDIDAFIWIGGVKVALSIVIELAVDRPSDLIDRLRERSEEFVEHLNATEENSVLWSGYHVRTDDNPVGEPFSTIDEHINRFGTWHMKGQCIRRAPLPSGGDEYVAYLGGIDLNPNRVDNYGHQVKSPYHDVHCRITGDAVVDVFQTFTERWDHDALQQPFAEPAAALTIPPPAVPVPEPSNANHIIQIARTLFRPRPSSSTVGFSFAPNGDKTINDTLIKALLSARHYIYLEDQYLIPNDNDEDPLDLNAFFNALVAVAPDCRKLVLLSGAAPDQYFGQDRRRHLLNRLHDAWGSKLIAVAPFRRPRLGEAQETAALGRCTLLKHPAFPDDETAYSETASELIMGPRVRVPKTASWLWIDGELMFVTNVEATADVDKIPVARVHVVRSELGTNARWGAAPRQHMSGAPVTFAQLQDIKVHSKIVIIDDAFVSIGSANLNRRGLFHDGELNAFAIPQRLLAARDNPARLLRTQLWAEHLGIPPAMGDALFRDPIAATQLFSRTRAEGNRSLPLFDVDVEPLISIDFKPTSVRDILELLGTGVLETQVERLWHTYIDPTTIDDPMPDSGPFPPGFI